MSNVIKRMKKRVNPFQESKQEKQTDEILVHGSMIYKCESCGKKWRMYLEKGIEEFGGITNLLRSLSGVSVEGWQKIYLG